MKDKEWSKKLKTLSKKKANFLRKTAGIFGFGKKIDIKKVYRTKIYK